MLPDAPHSHSYPSLGGAGSTTPAPQDRPQLRPGSGARHHSQGYSERTPASMGPRPMMRGFGQRPNGGASSNRSSPGSRRIHGGFSGAGMIPPGWITRQSATLILRGIPKAATPWDIRQHFQKYGEVVWVELDDASRGGSRSAKIRFQPPPTDTSFFQNGNCRLIIGGTPSRARIDFPKQLPEENKLTTPLGNLCPASVLVFPKKLAFGILTQPATFMMRKEFTTLGGDRGLKVMIDFRRMRILIYFLPAGFSAEYHRMDIKFGIVKSIHRTSIDGGGPVLVLTLADAPLVRKKVADVGGQLWSDRLVWGEDELWHRVVGIRREEAIGPLSLAEEGGIDVGRWTTYCMTLDKAEEEQWCIAEMHLWDWNIKTSFNVSFTQIPGKKAELWDMLAETPSESSSGASSAPSWSEDLALLGSAAQMSLPFEVRYQLEVCLSRGILNEHSVKREFLEKLLDISQPDGMGFNRARLILEYAADEGKRIYDPMSLFTDKAALTYYPNTLHIPAYCALVRKVTVTPTRIYFSTPTVETTNRIVRCYHQVQDHFIRVQFTDELLDGRIRACDTDRDDQLYTKVYRVLTQGIRMGKWHWKFLAFGNSQIRECSTFFFCQPEGDPETVITCDKIRSWMGDFIHISSIAKLAARLGQCFSTTRLLPSVPSPRIVKISDVEEGKFCFTDGVGKISPVLAHFVAQDWNLDTTPSAFQFRMGGCKGILVTWPEIKGTEVHIRPSQHKFPAKYNGLEIIRCSHFSCATLNRQTIMILSCLGVSDEVFTDMLREQVSNYDAALTNENKAIELLSAYVDENMTTTTIADMVKDGFMHTNEPFFRTILQLWRSWSIKALKEKARIIVEQGAFVLGCADETGTLRGHSAATEGQQKIERDQLPQIFLQVPDPQDRGTYKVITGLCIVGRNPSLHPGDIRVVEAVDVPQLRGLKDVVVFPLKGDRDIPGMLSGGDLDGDDFFVIWDPKLLPSEWGHPPMNYTAPPPLVDSTAAMEKSLTAFFVLFMKNDRLPLIAHAHLATADSEPEGAKHRKCLELAQLHSTAVDYVKTGIPATWNKKLDPRRFPHYMEKSKAKSYRSNSVLGKLYDMVSNEGFDNSENYKLPFDDRILKAFDLDHELLKEARKIKSQYDIAMRRIMGQLEIKTEFEVWTTFVMSKPRIGTEYKVQEKVGREAAGLKKQFRDLCIKAAGDRTAGKMHPFVAAMYRVTWEETRIALHEARHPHVRPDGTVALRRVTARSMPLISFPWLFSNELGRIALGFERMPEFNELRAGKPKVNKGGLRQVDLEIETDLAEMDCKRVSDGRFIHRGEILHLFRHDDDVEGGGGSVEASQSPEPAESEPDGVAEEQEEIPVVDKTESTEDVKDGTQVLPALETTVGNKGDVGSGSILASSTSEVLQTSSSQPSKSGGNQVPGSLDLISFDEDEHSIPFVSLVPLKLDPPAQDSPQTAIETPGQQTGQDIPEFSATTHSATGPSEPTANIKPAIVNVIKNWDHLTPTKPDTDTDSSTEAVSTADSSGSSTIRARGLPITRLVIPEHNGDERPPSLSSAGTSARDTPIDDASSSSQSLMGGLGMTVGDRGSIGAQGGQREEQEKRGEQENGEEEEDTEVEYEEVEVVVEGETALERAARLA